MLPDLGGLPTDNLYKFLALAGLLLFISIAGLVTVVLLQLWARVEDQEIAIEVTGAEIANHRREAEHLAGLTDPSPDRLADLKASNLALAKKVAESKARHRLLGERLTFAKRIVRGALVGLLVAIVVTIVGFLLWYTKLQRYQDIVIRQEAERLLAPPSADSILEVPSTRR